MATRGDDRRIDVFQCRAGHAYFVAHERCGKCGEALASREHSASALLVCQTTVRVNPTGRPYRLGIAEIAAGARTLCVVGETVPRGDAVPVVLRKRYGLYHAVFEVGQDTG